MPKLPKFMEGVPKLPQNNSPSAVDGSQVTTFDYTHGNKYVHGQEPVGHKTVNAKSDHMVEGSSKGDAKQIKKRTGRSK